MRQQLADGDPGSRRIAERHTDDRGQTLTDRFVERQHAVTDELEDDGGGDDLGDAGDTEAVRGRHGIVGCVGDRVPNAAAWTS